MKVALAACLSVVVLMIGVFMSCSSFRFEAVCPNGQKVSVASKYMLFNRQVKLEKICGEFSLGGKSEAEKEAIEILKKGERD